MDDVTRRRIESLDRCETWFIAYAAAVALNLKLEATKILFIAKLAALRSNVGEQAAALSESYEQTNVKEVSREDCVEIASKVNRAAKAAEFEQPGIQARYPYPRNLNDEDLIALLRSYVIGGVEDKTIIGDYGAPVEWPLECTAKADAFEAAAAAQSAATGQKIGKRAANLAEVDELMQLKRTSGFIIENVFADNIEALASWRSAAHVENPPKKKAPPTP